MTKQNRVLLSVFLLTATSHLQIVYVTLKLHCIIGKWYLLYLFHNVLSAMLLAIFKRGLITNLAQLYMLLFHFINTFGTEGFS